MAQYALNDGLMSGVAWVITESTQARQMLTLRERLIQVHPW